MRALPASDKRNWKNQAEIHGAILGGFGVCRHSSWYFLPWHRAYLYCFEEIIRELSGDQNFALPYWDWSTQTTLPAPFWGNNNPLNNPARPGQPGSGRRQGLTPTTAISQVELDRFVGQTVVSQILGIQDFETFGGTAVDNLDDESGLQGRLENGPHNFIHRWVGGDMVTGGSPYDPIFWLHHCNLDRLWAEWVRKHPRGTPSDAGWLDTVFKDKYRFYDRLGAPLESLTVKQMLDPAKLGYRFDSRNRVVLPQLNAAFVRPEIVRGPSARFQMENGVMASSLTPSQAEADHLQGIVEGTDDNALRQTIRMKLSGVKVPKSKDVLIQVHVNCRKITPELGMTDPSYVGSSTFFSHGDHGNHSGDTLTASFMFSLNPTFARLYADRPFSASEPIKVVVLTKPLFADGPRMEPAEIQEISPQQVTIETVTAAA
jgi:hypothetical protein